MILAATWGCVEGDSGAVVKLAASWGRGGVEGIGARSKLILSYAVASGRDPNERYYRKVYEN